MFNHKLTLKLIVLLCTAVLFFGAAAVSWDYIRPLNPIMDYVPQNIGVYDTYYENFKESDCRVCHGASTEERHHGTSYALQGNCAFCHLGGVQSDPERDCKVCHIDGGPIGDFGSPHHRSDLAGYSRCNLCHLQVVEYNTIEPPRYAPTSTTPTPYSCENCHWPSGSMRHEAATYDGDTLKFLGDWQSWTGYPVPTTWPDSLAHPQPIEANGPVFSGILGAVPYIPTDGTHHELDGIVFKRCYYCHASAPGANMDWNPTNPYLIRFCENCHDVATLHNIQGHVTDNNIYRVGGISNQRVAASEKCVGCHNNSMSYLPSLPADIPVIDYLEPDLGPPGTIVNIVPAQGACFQQDPVNGLCSFGLKMKGDGVGMGQKDIYGNWYWVSAPIYSWSEHLIQIEVPKQRFQPGKAVVKVHKELEGTSAIKVFTILHNPVISSLTPSYGNWGQNVIVGGDGFSVKKEIIYESGYGYSTYMELYSSDDKYRVTKYPMQESWNPYRIFVGLTDLLDINTGNPVSEQDLYPGCWNMKIITDYFKDNSVNGTPGKYNLDMGGFDPADELLYRAISNPVCFTVAKDPYIGGVMPDRIPNGGILEIDGVNFGATKGMSYVLGGKDSSLVEIMGDGKGNEDGVCQKAEYLEGGCTLDPAKSTKIPIVGWNNNKIVCDLPTLSTGLPLRVHVQVMVEGTKKSNVKKIVIY